MARFLSHPARLKVATGALISYWLALVTATHWPLAFPPEAKPLLSSDKLLHFSAYAGLGFLLYLVLRLRETQSEMFEPRTIRTAVVAAVVAILAGLADELTQPLFNRDFEWYDWLADSVGAVCGVATCSLLFWLLERAPLAADVAVASDRSQI